MNGWSFKDVHFVKLEALRMLADDPLKRNNAMKACLINPNVLYHAFSLNIYEYW